MRPPRNRGSASRALLVGCLVAAASIASPARGDDPAISRCIAANDQGLDLLNQGKLLQARKTFATCAAPSCGANISEACQKEIDEVNGKLPTVVFVTQNGAGEDVAGVKLFVDGGLYAERLDGSAVVIDPGEHEFRFEVAGQAPVTKRFVLRQGEQNRREEIRIGPAAAKPPPTPSAPQPGNVVVVSLPQQPPPPPPTKLDSTGSFQRTMGTLLLAVALPVTIIGGAAQSLDAVSKWTSAQHDCTAGNCGPGSVAQNEKHDADVSAMWATVWVSGAGVALVGGIVLRATAPARRLVPLRGDMQLVPAMSPGGGAMFLRGSFQ